MNTMLRYAQKEVEKLKRAKETSNITALDLVLVFDRCEEDTKNLVGYRAFAEALANETDGKHTEANIQRACQVSRMSRDSILFDDMNNGEQYEELRISLTCTKAQAIKAIRNHRANNSYIQYSVD